MCWMRFKKIYRFFKDEGVYTALARLLLSITQVFFKYRKMYLYHLDLRNFEPETVCSLPVSFRRAHDDELSALDQVMYHSQRDIQKRFLRGDACYIGCLFDKVVYFSWISRRMLIPEIDKEMPLSADSAYIYNVRTIMDYRGRGISTYAYAKIAAYLKDSNLKGLYVAVDGNNIASIKSIEKSGFKMIREVVYLKINFLLKRYYETDLMKGDHLKCIV